MKSVCVLWALLMLFVVSQAWAGTTYTMGYPPAGGVTLTQSGNPISNGGGTFAFSGFNTMDYVSLYWGVNTVANVAQSNVASPGNMTFYSYNPSTGIIAFVSTAPWTFTNTLNNTTVSMQTQLVVQLQPFGSPAGFLGSVRSGRGHNNQRRPRRQRRGHRSSVSDHQRWRVSSHFRIRDVGRLQRGHRQRHRRAGFLHQQRRRKPYYRV